MEPNWLSILPRDIRILIVKYCFTRDKIIIGHILDYIQEDYKGLRIEKLIEMLNLPKRNITLAEFLALLLENLPQYEQFSSCFDLVTGSINNILLNTKSLYRLVNYTSVYCSEPQYCFVKIMED